MQALTFRSSNGLRSLESSESPIVADTHTTSLGTPPRIARNIIVWISLRVNLLACVLLPTLTLTTLSSQTPNVRPSTAGTMPVVGKAPRYVNPLNIEADSKDGSPTGVSLGDPTIVRDGDKYYMFATGGGPWVSEDLVTWRYIPVSANGARVPVAPHVVKYRGAFYMTGNGSPLYRSTAILGPYEEVGRWSDKEGNPIAQRVFDVDIFVDTDNSPYVYMSYGATAGIWGARLDSTHLNRLVGPPKTLFSFNTEHTWERSGNSNERSYFAYIEGPWVFKRNGIYYLEYSASGTEWLTYATGVYTAKSPLGPFTYMRRNPFLRQINGLVTGPGHGSAIQSPDGGWWQFYLTVLPNPPGGRRIGMDPIGFEPDGTMFTRNGVPSETPQWVPGVVKNPVVDGNSGSVPLTFGKVRQLMASSHAPGRDPEYALDDSNGTWWEPAESDLQPSITVDLLQIAPFDQPYTVDSSRLIFTARAPVGFGAGRGRGGGPPPPVAPFSGAPAFRYKIEGSIDGENFITLVDKTQNNITRYTEFDEISPTRCRFIRLIMTDWPRSAQQPLGISEFTVFGKYIQN